MDIVNNLRCARNSCEGTSIYHWTCEICSSTPPTPSGPRTVKSILGVNSLIVSDFFVFKANAKTYVILYDDKCPLHVSDGLRTYDRMTNIRKNEWPKTILGFFFLVLNIFEHILL